MIQSNTSIQNQPLTQQISGFSIKKIIFDEGNFATLWVKCRISGNVAEQHLVLPFAKLNDILRFSGAAGEKVLLKMLDIMMFASKPPYVLEIATDLNTEIIITSCKLQITAMLDNNILVPNCFYVTDVTPINIIQQAKNLHQHLHDFNMASLTPTTENNSMQQLSKMYAHYLGLLELDIIEPVARQRAQLADARLFKMAATAFDKKDTV